MKHNKLAQVYRDAAELVDSGLQTWSCNAVCKAARNYETQDEKFFYATTMSPRDPSKCEPKQLLLGIRDIGTATHDLVNHFHDWLTLRREFRVWLLCMMAAYVEAEGIKEAPRYEK